MTINTLQSTEFVTYRTVFSVTASSCVLSHMFLVAAQAATTLPLLFHPISFVQSALHHDAMSENQSIYHFLVIPQCLLTVSPSLLYFWKGVASPPLPAKDALTHCWAIVCVIILLFAVSASMHYFHSVHFFQSAVSCGLLILYWRNALARSSYPFFAWMLPYRPNRQQIHNA